MGGSLTARSEGPHKGAEFTLELPCAPHNATSGAISP
jgi:signal transduction histidine kinase